MKNVFQNKFDVWLLENMFSEYTDLIRKIWDRKQLRRYWKKRRINCKSITINSYGIGRYNIDSDSFLDKSRNKAIVSRLVATSRIVFIFKETSYSLYFIQYNVLATKNVFMRNGSNRSRTNERITRSANS